MATLTLDFHLDSNDQSVVLKDEEIFQHHRKNDYWKGTKHGGYGFGESRFFWWRLMSMHEHLRILAYIFFGIRKTATRKVSTNKFPLVNSPLENSHPENSHLEYPRPSFLIFFIIVTVIIDIT